MSADGGIIAFASEANNLVAGENNLVAGENNPESDVFVKDLTTGEVRLASATATGEVATEMSYGPSLSDDGRIVASVSNDPDLVPVGSNPYEDVFVIDMTTGEIRIASVPPSNEPSEDDSDTAALSADGKTVAIVSEAANLVPGDTNEEVDVFVTETGLGASTPTFQPGDVNRDRSRDVTDAVLILRIIVESFQPDEEQSALSNVNGDASTDVSDAVALLRFIVGL